MTNQRIIWWIIVIAMAIVIVWSFYWKEEEQDKCCTFEGLGLGEADGISSMTYCKRDGKYYSSGTGGFTGTIPEKEISEQAFNSAWQNGKCKK